MNLSDDALRDLRVLTELKSEGGIFERHFVLLKEHAMKGRLVGAPSLDRFRMSLQLRDHFWGTGKRISKVEKKAHDPRVDVFFQNNAWADSDFCMAWAKRCIRKSLMQGGVLAEESLLTLDNLHEQTTETFKAYMKKECNSLVWH